MITGYTTSRSGNITSVRVTSSLSGVVYYFWYLDGAFMGMTTSPTKTFSLEPADQAQIVCLDSNDPAFDPIANAPVGWPARRTLVWVRSVDTAAKYRVEQKQGSGAWAVIGYVPVDPTTWNYQFLTPRLLDLTSYAWRVIPMDALGNDGTSIALASELIVRTPDAPSFHATLNGSQEVVFTP